VPLPSAPAREAPSHCDLRGLRAGEAVERLTGALDAAAAAGNPQLVVVHGVGTGALLRVVREHLRESPYVANFEVGDPEAGGEGITVARLR
jgi:DNA mismatch repair protein MutS2